MARQTPILKKTFTADAAIAAAAVNCCFCASPTNAGNVALPANHFVGNYLQLTASGVTQTGTSFVGVCDQISDSNNVALFTVAGIVQIQSDGSAIITAGDQVAIANVSGQIKTYVPYAPATPGTITNWIGRQIIGVALSSVAATANLLVDVLLQPCVFVGA